LFCFSSLLGCSGDIGDGADSGAGSGGGPAPAASDPGRVTLHRLNRAEYNNSVRDLLGTSLRPADDFPADDHSYGFDNMADTLTVSPTQLELYALAAESLAAEAMALPSLSTTQMFEAEEQIGTAGAATGGAWNLWSNGELPVTVVFPVDGQYKISTVVWGDQAGPEPARMSLTMGGVSLGTFDVPETAASPRLVEVTTTATTGTQVVAVEFLNDFYDPANGLDRNLYVDWVSVEGPLGVVATNPIRDALVTCDLAAQGKACAREVIASFAARAWRRPLSEAEVDALVAFVDLAEAQGDTVDAGLEVALTAILTSPHFLFRVELDADPASTEAHPLGGYELASRLSYFLWSSVPDAELFAAAGDGRLDSVEGIRAQVTRMLADPRSDALIDNFAGQWLYTRALADHTADYATYPAFDAELRDAMREETERFFRELLDGDYALEELLTADFTFLDGRLAAHYGLPAPGSAEMSRVPLGTDQRGGLLTQASLLTVTSYPARTSPVKRGKWLLTQLLCSEPPPPPPDVPPLEEPNGTPTGSVRDRLEEHRKDPVCAACHEAMDPLGFGLEHFDGIGAWRDEDRGFAVDATGVLPSGESFDGARQMASLIVQDPRFPACVADRLFTYALGRGLVAADAPYVEQVVDEAGASQARLRELVALVATSDPFRMRRGEAAPKKMGGQP
jgi:hypothetical protein